MSELEKIVDKESQISNKNSGAVSPQQMAFSQFYSVLPKKIKNCMASTTAGWVAYTPIMAPIEYFHAGMDWDEVGVARLCAGFGHLIGLPPYQKVREYLGRIFDIGENNKWKQRIVNAVSFVPTQPPTYTLMLYMAGASLDEMKYAIPAGLGVVIATSPLFTPFMEFWRKKVWKIKPTYKANQELV